MKFGKDSIVFLFAIVVGIILGYVGGPVFILIPWGIACVVIGVFSSGKKWAIINGTAFGFAVSYVFMLVGYSGQAPISTRLLPFVVLGLIGAACGLVLSLISNVIYKYIQNGK